MYVNIFLSEFINGLSGRLELLDAIMVMISKTAPYILMLSTVIYYMMGIINRNKSLRMIAFDTVIKTCIAVIISQFIGKIFPTDRPFVANKDINTLYPHKPNSSFPSDHSLGCMSIALGLNKYASKFNAIFILLAIITGFSRVYVGHHYPLDVLGGFLLAQITSILYDKYLKEKLGLIYLFIENNILNRYINICKTKKTL